MNSSIDESTRLWKRLVWFEAIVLEKNAPELLEMDEFIQLRGAASERYGFIH